MATTRSPEDGLPHGGMAVEAEDGCICYELLVRLHGRKYWVIVRVYDAGTAGLATRPA